MRETLTFHAKMDARGKIQIPKREYEHMGWVKGLVLKVTIRPDARELQAEKDAINAKFDELSKEEKA